MKKLLVCIKLASRLAAALMLASLPALSRAQYDPPAGYYSPASGTGAALKSQIHGIIAKDWYNASSTSHRVTSYSTLPQAMAVTDLDPNNSNNIILVYTGASVDKTWDTVKLPWNKEHTWPDSLGPNGSGPDYSDQHHLRPCNTQVNSNRGNLPFGIGSGYWDPNQGCIDRGDMARAMFYMDTRYDGTESATTDLTLVNGQPGANQMGDLAKLLQWHYQDPPSTWEKLRNQRVFDKTLNPNYYQGNRNPFIDHPEYVWTIFGGGNNNSRICIGGASLNDGSSSATVSLGRVMKYGALGSATITLNKSGVNPTTFDIALAGAATSTAAGAGSTFDYNAQSRTLGVGLSASTATTGLKTGTITIDNTDLSTGGTGLGCADGNDAIAVSAAVVDNRIVTASAVDFGRVIGNKLYAQATSLCTSGDDNDFTRLTVSGASACANGITVEASASQLFDGPTDSATRTVCARFRSAGLKGGIVPLAVSGEGLMGEAVHAVWVNYSAQVMDGAEIGALLPSSASLDIDFGTVQLASEQSRSFPIQSWLEEAELSSAVDLTQLHVSGNALAFSTNLAELVSGDTTDLLTGLDTALPGQFGAVYDLKLANSSQPLTISFQATVVPEPTVILAVLLPVLLKRRFRPVRR